MKELELTLVVRNNLLKERRDELGLTRAKLAKKIGMAPNDYGKLEALRESPFKILRELRCMAPGCDVVSNFTRFCEEHRTAPVDIKEIWRDANRRRPKKYGKEWTAAAIKIAIFWRCLPEDLFPQEVVEIRTSQVTRKLDVAETPGLLGQASEALALPPDKAVEEADLRRMIDESLSLLPSREAEIIRKRFGLAGMHEHTLAEVGKDEGVTGTRIREIEIKVLGQLRRRFGPGKLLADFDHRRR